MNRLILTGRLANTPILTKVRGIAHSTLRLQPDPPMHGGSLTVECWGTVAVAASVRLRIVDRVVVYGWLDAIRDEAGERAEIVAFRIVRLERPVLDDSPPWGATTPGSADHDVHEGRSR